MHHTIAIDASRAFVHERTGIEEYAYQLIKALRDSLQNERVVLYARFSGEAAIDPRGWITRHFFTVPDAWEVRVVRHRRLWTQWWLAWRLRRDRPDVLLVPAHTVPWIHPRKTIVVIHGLEYEITPHAYSRWARWYMRWSIRFSCRWAWKIVAVSQNTKRDLVRLYGVAPERIVVIPEGVNAPDDVTQSEDAPLPPSIRPPYIAFVGRIEERKNITRIVAAFDSIKKTTHLPHMLVLVGRDGHGAAAAHAAIDAAAYADAIVRVGYVDEATKWAIVTHAALLVFPSLSEGFGLPILEAQSVGVPVVASAIPSLQEVAGDSALLVDPCDHDAIAAAMYTILTDPLQRRAIIDKGFANCARFSWKTCAQSLVALWRTHAEDVRNGDGHHDEPL